jgi:hypothetical protein
VTAEVRAHADDERPAWSLAIDAVDEIALDNPLPERVDREWAFGSATGESVKVCVLDSGVEPDHPAVGAVAGAVAISLDEEGTTVVTPDEEGDLCGHGTACAGVIRALAPAADIYSVRVLGSGFTGTGQVLLAGLRWAVEQDYDVINMSLSTTKRAFSEMLREIADTAYFKRTVLVGLGAQHARRVVPIAFFVGDLRRQPRGGRSDDVLREPRPARRVLRARRRRRGRLDRRLDDHCSGQQLRGPLHLGACGARPFEAPSPDAVPAEERAVPHRVERGREHMTDDLHAAVAAGVLPAEERFVELLGAIVEVARAIFHARGSSIFLYDEQTDELVFAAVANAEDRSLLGMRIPAATGIAGWVLSSGTPLVIDDLENDPRFARDVAERTGYVPKGLMAVPLLHDERALGVLQVLDRPRRSRFSLAEMELLGLFATQAAVALDLLASARRARAALDGHGTASVVARLAAALEGLDEERREPAQVLLRDLERLFAS